MRKEVLIAIIAGIVFGAAVAFGIWRANIAFNPNSKNSTKPSDYKKENTANNEFGLTIANVEENDIATQSPFELNGITQANSWIVISSEEDDSVIQSDENGEFASSFEPVGGINTVMLAAFSHTGASIYKNTTIIYSTKFEKRVTSLEESSETEEATPESDAVRERVKQKIAEAQNKPLAYLGSITDIVETTIQIKNGNEEIKQVSVNEEDTDFVQLGKETKTLSFSDVAIGDFIVAMGYKDENDVLETSRVLVTQSPQEQTRKIIYGKVVEIKGKVLTLATSNGDYSATFPIRWKGPEINELETDDTVVIITTKRDEKQFIRTIEILSSP